MPINFPSNPSTNDVYTYGGRSWKYNGTGWETTNPVAANAGGDLTGTYPNPTIASGAVTSAKIADGAIVTNDIADGAVSDVKLSTALADNLGINNGTNTRRIQSVTSAERTNSSTSVIAVGGGSTVTFGASNDAIVLLGVRAELKSNSVSYNCYFGLRLQSTGQFLGQGDAQAGLGAGGKLAAYASSTYASYSAGWVGTMFASGTHTVEAVFSSDLNGVAYVRNLTISAIVMDI